MTVFRVVVTPLLATFVVSIIPIGVLRLLPNVSRMTGRRRLALEKSFPFSNVFLNTLLCFAAGSLIADALLHLLVQSIFGDFPSSENTRKQAFATTMGVAAFFIMDLLTRSFHKHDFPSANDHDELELPAVQRTCTLEPPNSRLEQSNDRLRKRGIPSPTLKMLSTGRLSPSPERIDACRNQKTNGILSLVADGVHNFTDGLAIAAAFARDYQLGLTTTMAIFFHEIPHELGDYAVLIKVGYKHQKIIRLQLLTAAGAFLGTLTGIAIQGGKASWLSFLDEETLLPFIAGGFIYIALCNILPGVFSDPASRQSIASTLGLIVAFLFGIVMMSLI